MPKYKPGDVAALFPVKKAPESESGKKLQSLFSNFYSRKANKPEDLQNVSNIKEKHWKVKEDVKEEIKQEEIQQSPKKNKFRKSKHSNSTPDIVEQAGNKFKKHKHSDSTPDSHEKPGKKFKKRKHSESAPDDTEQVGGKSKIKNEPQIMDFPRRKSKKQDFKNESFDQSFDHDNLFQVNQEDEILHSTDFAENEQGSKKKKRKNFKSSNLFVSESNEFSNNSKMKRKSFDMSDSFESESTYSSQNLKKKKKSDKLYVSDSFESKFTEASQKLKKKKNKSIESNHEINSSETEQTSKSEYTTNIQNHNGSPKKLGKKKKKSKSPATESTNANTDPTESISKIFPKKKNSIENTVTANDSKSEDASESGVFSNKNFIPLRTKPAETEERLKRTLFVGNLPMSTTKKDLKKLFNPFGPLENARLRCSIPVKSSIPKKIAEIQRKFHSGQHSQKAYVVFKMQPDAMEALALNGKLLEKHHIIVDRAIGQGERKTYDENRTVFVGNLPFAVDDETVWSSFEQFGDIEAVRVVKDQETGAGKGFGYVLFQDIASKENALASNGVQIQGREIRIKQTENRNRQQKSTPTNPTKEQKWKDRKMGALKMKRKFENKKSLKKIMKRGKLQHQKKEIAKILSK